MKKSLFAIAAVTAFAGAAQAQSSVSVYGILDVGYVGGNERLAGPSVNGSRVNQQTTNSFNQSAQSTSRLGFRGREDLGKGMAAFFVIETAILPNTTPGAPGANSVFGAARAANVGLSQKGVGQAVIGLQNTVITDAISPTITGQFNNIVGSLLFPGQTTSATGGTTGSTGLQTAGIATNSANGSTDAFTFRTSNTLKLQTERMAGIQASAMVVMNDTTQTQRTPALNGTTGYSGGKNNQNGWGLGLNYTFKKFTGTAAYQSLKAIDPNGSPVGSFSSSTGLPTITAAGTPAPFNSSTGAGGVNVTDNQAYVGATYDFGILKAYAGWIDRKVTSQINANQYAKRTAQEIGVRGNWTPKIESWASIGNGRINTFGANSPSANLTGWQLGSNYILSKRTNLYAIYGQTGTSNASNNVAGANQSYNSNNYALGIRHTF